MPYIEDWRRKEINNGDSPDTVGELNYTITTIVTGYLSGFESYKLYNDVIGVLECVKLELYRRRLATYEDAKRKENGDVF